jgi:3-oxoacyl-[acyl-carrier protein] reductase
VNVKGTFLLTKESLRMIMKSNNPSIVNLGSVVGLMGNAGQCAYSASKAALLGFTKSLARELSSRKVQVNLIAPGYIDTDMTSSMSEEQKSALSEMIPLGRVGKPEEIAYAVSYLLSPLSQYVTGQVLNVNGGMYM